MHHLQEKIKTKVQQYNEKGNAIHVLHMGTAW